MTQIDRRGVVTLAGGAALAVLAPGAVRAAVAGDAAGLEPGYVEAALDTGGVLHGYLVRPASDARKLPGVVLVHDGAGLTAPMRDAADRLAREGFLGFAPDMVAGGTPADAAVARATLARLARPVAAGEAAAAVRWLGAERRTTGAVAILGYGWGGGVADAVATAARKTARAAVVFYGADYGVAADDGAAAGGSVPLLLHLAGQDAALNRRAERWVRALQRAGGEVTSFYYPTARHGFAEPGPAFDMAAEALAWDRTIAFLRQRLA